MQGDASRFYYFLSLHKTYANGTALEGVVLGGAVLEEGGGGRTWRRRGGALEGKETEVTVLDRGRVDEGCVGGGGAGGYKW
ncbi:hypothetical protein, partial [Bartonella raoultii]|uniref:hypothetical protein n=1 Tax=Bartonella raoultii TaxID=1457020 RepID=UPI001ABA4087